MAGSLLADLSRMGSENAFTDLLLTAQGGRRAKGFHINIVLDMFDGCISGGRHVGCVGVWIACSSLMFNFGSLFDLAWIIGLADLDSCGQASQVTRGRPTVSFLQHVPTFSSRCDPDASGLSMYTELYIV